MKDKLAIDRREYHSARRKKRKAKGLCQRCGSNLYEGSKSYCKRHLLEHRIEMRERGGHDPQYLKGIGRPPLVVPKHVG